MTPACGVTGKQDILLNSKQKRDISDVSETSTNQLLQGPQKRDHDMLGKDRGEQNGGYLGGHTQQRAYAPRDLSVERLRDYACCLRSRDRLARFARTAAAAFPKRSELWEKP